MASGLQGHLDRITDGLKDLDGPTAAIPETPQASPKGKGSAMPATSALAHFSDELAEIRKAAGQPMRVRMDLCDDGPYHSTPIDPERVAGLQANMKENGQSAPALLRKKPDGRFEIVAGRHRKAALMASGEGEWDAVLKDISDDQAERLTFYDNLLAPNLTDYARFMGFARRKQSRGFTDQQLADESGVSRPTVVRLMSFQHLPERARSAVAGMPSKTAMAVTGNFVIDLVKHVPEAADRVCEALEKVAAGALSVPDALKWVQNTQPAKPAPTRAVAHIVRVGKKTFAKVSRKEGRVVVDFTNKEQGGELEKAIIALVEDYAKETQRHKASQNR